MKLTARSCSECGRVTTHPDSRECWYCSSSLEGAALERITVDDGESGTTPTAAAHLLHGLAALFIGGVVTLFGFFALAAGALAAATSGQEWSQTDHVLNACWFVGWIVLILGTWVGLFRSVAKFGR